ncbi:hypothetical protein UA08_08960 [Talaromyces atroroseus]|uniref:Uncharacterized protein n=1 Tax=Talaromyces atroroseus TaxID=1441469 RepID=A0A1Q5Q742_TALAT|nr:hypothetical protein UA08_08960 [Talaromyces atroroseus]OKL55668.1 hypothetical protein UA08_08960 [Talaromyces atroroseus]
MGIGEHCVPQYLQARMIEHMAAGPTPGEAARIVAMQKKTTKKTTTKTVTAKGKKATKHAAPETAPEPATEPVHAPVRELEAMITIEQPATPPPIQATSPIINPAQLSNLSPIPSTAPATLTAPKSLRSRGLNQPVDMRNDPEQPLREQRRRERSRSQSYDNTPLPPLPPLPQMNVNIDDDHCVILDSVSSFQEIDSGELNSDARRDILFRFTNHHIYYPQNSLIHEEAEETAQISTITRSSPDALL